MSQNSQIPFTQAPGPSIMQTGDENKPQGLMDINEAITGNSHEKGARIKIHGNLPTKAQMK